MRATKAGGHLRRRGAIAVAGSCLLHAGLLIVVFPRVTTVVFEDEPSRLQVTVTPVRIDRVPPPTLRPQTPGRRHPPAPNGTPKPPPVAHAPTPEPASHGGNGLPRRGPSPSLVPSAPPVKMKHPAPSEPSPMASQPTAAGTATPTPAASPTVTAALGATPDGCPTPVPLRPGDLTPIAAPAARVCAYVLFSTDPNGGPEAAKAAWHDTRTNIPQAPPGPDDQTLRHASVLLRRTMTRRLASTLFVLDRTTEGGVPYCIAWEVVLRPPDGGSPLSGYVVGRCQSLRNFDSWGEAGDGQIIVLPP